MVKDAVFTTREITQILRIHPQTFSGWLKKRILWPRIYEARGKGMAHLFDLANLFEAGLIRELTKDNYSLDFVGAVLGHLEERQFIKTFLDRVSRGLESDTEVYLLWRGDFVGQPSSMELIEVGKSKTELELGCEEFERTLVINLGRLVNRICFELEELGVKI